MLLVDAEPYEFAFEPAAAALLIIDMQRDFPRAWRVRRVARQRCEPAAPRWQRYGTAPRL